MTVEEIVAQEIERNRKMAAANKAIAKSIWGDQIK